MPPLLEWLRRFADYSLSPISTFAREKKRSSQEIVCSWSLISFGKKVTFGMRTSADHNWNFSYGGVFPPSFSNQIVVPLQPATLSNVTDLISEGMRASVDVRSMAGLILPGNLVTRSNSSPIMPLPGNLSGNIVLDPVPPLKLSPAAAASWSLEELYVLRQGLVEYATEPTSIMKYIKIAAKLPEKTVRDVAMRCQWIAKESGKRRKLGSYYAEKKEKVVYSSSLSTVTSVQPKGTTYSSLRIYDVPSNKQPSQGASPVNTETQCLLMENCNLLNQIGSNLELSKLEDNINLFYRTRVNIATVLNRMSDKLGMMSQMPPLPVLIDDNLFQPILPLARQVL
ncbi:uncharacterized protein LOC122016823 isoform X1 [Zingiber officinale]|uniref:uncharacterized protein LOC122016823 isoform X1 n=1 Tax=Zingiber officinale TaxID=94328 RepID=UPI001C4B51C5|nr:uncharacterized protein LOC122016823 isoform X1 [Zingiber officinale]